MLLTGFAGWKPHKWEMLSFNTRFDAKLNARYFFWLHKSQMHIKSDTLVARSWNAAIAKVCHCYLTCVAVSGEPCITFPWFACWFGAHSGN